MIETIHLENKELKLSSSAAFLLIYKQQFKKEPLQDIMQISSKLKDVNREDITSMIAGMELEIIYNLAWALAKTANYKNISDPISFYIEYGDFLPLDHIDTILEMSLSSITPDFELEEEEKEEKN